MTTYNTTFEQQLGQTNEKINVTFEYCEDFTGDGKDDIKVTLSIAPESNSGTENIIGVAFDIQNNAVGGLSITQIDGTDGKENSLVSANGVTVQSFGLGLGNQDAYDVGVQFTTPPDLVQTASFVITSTGTDLDAEALLENTNWYVRLQETDGGEESAKTGGFVLDLPPCGEEPPPPGEDGVANTPGFWKQSQHFQFWEQPYDPTDSFRSTFGLGVNVSLPFTDTLLGALSAGGGGASALGRAATAALLNAASDEAGTGINYIINDIDALKIGIAEVYGSGWTQAQLDSVLGTLDIIDSNNDNRIGTTEVKTAVQDAFGVIAGPLSIGQVAIAFDTMNNMPSLEVGDF